MISLNYNPFAVTFSDSRKDLRWAEIEYFFNILKERSNPKILDVGCGNGRLLDLMNKDNIKYSSYLGVDSSEILLSECKKDYPQAKLILLDMRELDKIDEKFTDIFLIASFHHLQTMDDRKKVLKDVYNLLEDGGMLYMTNWALESEINYMKYRSSQIDNSENEFGSTDFKIKIGDFNRFYHNFTLEELNSLIEEAGFTIVENREFENKKNIITIAKKIED